MKRVHCVIFSLSLVITPAFAQDLLKPPAQTDSPVIDSGPATDVISEPVVNASGRIEAIDADAGLVTIAHDAVPALKWPASTMDFQARGEQLEGLSVGDQVRISVQSEGDQAALVSIEKR